MASYTSGSVVFSEFGMDALAFLAGGRRVAGGFGPDHGHAHRGRHLGVELDWHRDGAEFLDRMTQFDLALVHLDPLSRQGLGDVLAGPLAELPSWLQLLVGRTADTTGARGESQRTAACDRGPASLE